MISLIAAMDVNGVIGYKGKMPWKHLPVDMKHFKETTLNKPIVMGRKTWESIGSKPLPKRDNLILTRSGRGILPVLPPRTYLSTVDEVTNLSKIYGTEFMVIGGAEIYKQFLPYADRLYITRIEAEFKGDTYFPIVDWNEWTMTNVQHTYKDENNAYDCSFYTFE